MKEYKLSFVPGNVEDHLDYVVYKNVRIPMSDGVELYASIWFPAKDGAVDFSKKYPVALQRAPYMDSGEIFMPGLTEYALVKRGFAVVLNAVRGTYKSDGVFEPGMNEGWGEKKDGVDTVKWIMEQPWCNGKVGTFGISYMGLTQYLLQLSGDVDGLETSVINCPAVNSGKFGWINFQDFLDAACFNYWVIGRQKDVGTRSKLPQDVQDAILADNEQFGNILANPAALNGTFFASLMSKYSLRDMPFAKHLPYYQEWLDNRDDLSYFDYNNTLERKHDMKKPILFQAGWYDLFSFNALAAYEKAVADAPSEEVAKGHRLIVGAYNHNFTPMVRKFPESETDESLFVAEWLEQQINGVESEFFRDNPVAMFVMGENKWRSEQAWPLPDAVPTKYYIHSGGRANTLMGNGKLSLTSPEAEPQDRYVYDPANPMASLGGNSVSCGGQCDQRAAEMRPDVLVYTSDVLTEDVEVTGYAKAKIYAATSAEDTDFFMRLLDVCPDGNVYNVISGGRRGRYIQNGRENPTALTPGEVYEYDIELRPTSYVFKKGHKIRVDITSSDSYHFDVNPNKLIDLNSCLASRDGVSAVQTIYHDAERPTHIELPIVPADRERNWINWPFHRDVTGVDSITAVIDTVMGNIRPPQPAAVLDGSELEKNK